jgi:anti-sigma regulatory factor (Ser/Thr protein kinase)
VSATSYPSGATPGGDDTRLEAVYPAVAQAVTSARHELAAYAERMGINGERLDSVRLAVSEAVANAVLHAYRGEPGAIRLTAAVTGGMLRVTVADHGCGHRMPAEKPGLGLGFGLMATASDEFELADGNPGTQVRLVFLLDASA